MMEKESEMLSCVVCSAHVTDSDSSDISSNYSYFAQFCGELEKCGKISKANDKPFKAQQFFHNVDLAASYLLVCCECKVLINEAMGIRMNLEKWEMEVLKVQIELLMKLRELEKFTDSYFNQMSRIYDKVINSMSKDDLQEEGMGFGETSLREDDVSLFREKILDVVANLAMFRDDFREKLGLPISLPASTSPNQSQSESMDYLDSETAEDIPPMQTDNLKDDPISNEDEDNMNSDNDNYQDDDYNANEQDDYHDDPDDDKQAVIPKASKKKTSKKKNGPKVSNIFEHLPELPFPMPNASKHKKLLIQNILIPPSPSPLQPPFTFDTVYPFLLQKYPWNYDPTSDTLTLATIPITIMDTESSLTLTCSHCYFSTVYKLKNNLRNWKTEFSPWLRKMFEHVVTSHLDGFRCPLDPNCNRKLGELKVVCRHLRNQHGLIFGAGRKEGLFHCSICGKGLGTLKECLDHEDTHKDNKDRDYVTCETCGKNMLRVQLKKHKRLNCGKKKPRTVCQICGLSLAKEWYLKGHMLRKHAGEEVKTFECEICGKKYAVGIDLKNHKINKHRIYPKGYERECRKGCGEKFARQSNMCKHEEKCDGRVKFKSV